MQLIGKTEKKIQNIIFSKSEVRQMDNFGNKKKDKKIKTKNKGQTHFLKYDRGYRED